MAKRNEDRITIQALKYYVPLFQQGEAAELELLEHDDLSPAEINKLETVAKLKEMSANKIAELSGPLITREINKLIAGSHLRTREDLFDILYYAGIDGMKRGLRKFEVEKINSSSTNYLFQWIVTYAKKELTSQEAPFGIPPSRFVRYKKISAVRKKLSEQIGRYAENHEVFDYFQSGQADIKTLNGRVADSAKASKANQQITIDLIQEQEDFERNMLNVELMDPQGTSTPGKIVTVNDTPPFEETLFGVFCSLYNITSEAKAVIVSELSPEKLSDGDLELLNNMSARAIRNLSNQWKNLIKDINGPFYKFLKHSEREAFTQFDVKNLLNSIESSEKSVNSALYKVLFINERPSKR